ncbi:MAG: DUF4058 family protein [Planctomycetia bacterium]|nr:DUF4058 family protein [Planctomycetia bacterium]
MPLLDHFHPPVKDRLPWTSLLASWATRVADRLNETWLSREFLAAEFVTVGNQTRIDIATFEESQHETRTQNGAPVATAPQVWSPPATTARLPAVFPEQFEVRVFDTVGGTKLVAAIELISPSNKDRGSERRAFATKCASYWHQGVSVVIIDIVTSRRANLHNEIMGMLEAAEPYSLPATADLDAVAYRPVLRNEKAEIDLWTETFALGQALPTMPLRLTGDTFVPVEFEATYQEACRRRRLA